MTTRPTSREAYEADYDLMNCEAEPLHHIRYVQSHAVFIVATLDNFIITNASDNVRTVFTKRIKNVVGSSLAQLLPKDVFELLEKGVEEENFKRFNPIHLFRKNRSYNIIAHIQDGLLIVEVEPRNMEASGWQVLMAIDEAIRRMQSSNQNDISDLLNITTEEIRNLTNFDRVMLYQFDAEFNGRVVAEAKAETLTPFLGLHYPASDIPQQARNLYLINQTRIIVDVKSSPSRIRPSLHPQSKNPLDLTHSVARGVSPIHLEYLTNMGVDATMSIAVIVDGKLWGLIACHHTEPKFIDYRTRNMVGFLGQILSGYLSLQIIQDFRQSSLSTNLVKAQLADHLNKNWDVVKGLLECDPNVSKLTNSAGAAIFTDDEIYTVGETPDEEQLLDLVSWLNTKNIDSYYATDQLSEEYPVAKTYQDIASGILAIRISQRADEYLIWIRPEKSYVVKWGGKPDKVVEQTADGERISPRKSFAKWEEEVSGKAIPWTDQDIQYALSLRSDILDFIFKKYDELKRVNEELQTSYKELETFSYTISHDLRAPLRGIDGFAEILSEDYEGKLDDYGKSLLQVIKDNVRKMNVLIDDILRLSKVSKNRVVPNTLDLSLIVKEVVADLVSLEKEGRQIDIQIAADLPNIRGDRTMIYQLFQNLLSNALKYTRSKENAVINIGFEKINDSDYAEFFIKDNGIGFDLKYKDKVFEVFSRLVDEEEFEGTGVGLSIVKKIVQQHKGQIKVKSEPNKGTTFYFSLPVAFEEIKH